MADLTPEEKAAIRALADQLPDPGNERASPLDPTGESLYTQANTFLSQLRSEAGRGLETALAGGPSRQAREGPLGTMGASLGAQLLNPVPGSIPQAAMMAVNPALALGPGGALRKGLTMGGIDAILGGLEGGPLGAAAAGTGGLLSGTLAGKLAQRGRPSQGLQAVQKTQQFGTEIGSDEVKALLKTMQAADLTREKSLRDLQHAASRSLQGIVDEIGKLFPKNQQIPVPKLDAAGAVGAGLSVGRMSPGGPEVAVGTFAELDKARRTLRAAENPAWRDIEHAMVQAANQHAGLLEGTPSGQAYKAALNQYRLDQRLIDLVEGIQQVRAKHVLGNLNPTDFPEAAEITRLGMGTASHRGLGVAETAIGATHPGSMFGLWHGLRGLQRLGGTSEPPLIRGPLTPPGAFTKLLSRLGAGGMSELPAVPRFTLTSTSPSTSLDEP